MTDESPSDRAPSAARHDPWSLALVTSALALGALQPLSNADTFGHLAQGRTIAALGRPPALDPYSFWSETPQPWVNYEWLSDWLTWEVYALAGPNALVAIATSLVALGGALVVLLAGRLAGRGAAWVTALLVVLAIPASRPRMSARPHLVALVLAGAYLLLVTRPDWARRGMRAAAPTLAALFALHVLWVNLHGSHLLGAGIVLCAAITGLGERAGRGPRLAACALVALASCISPYGERIVLDALLHVFDPRYRHAITEWHSIFELGDRWTIAHTCTLLAAALVALATAVRGGPARAALGVVAVALGLLTLRSGRFALEMLVIGAPLVGVELALHARTAPLVERALAPATRALTALGALTLACTLAVLTTSDFPIGAGVDARTLPDDASTFIEERLPGARVLGSMPSSWYVLFRAPSARVLVDGRLPFYGPEHAAIAEAAMDTEGRLLPVVRRYGVTAVLVQHTAPPDAAALRTLAGSPRFVRAWVDGAFAVYVRADAPLAAGLDPARFDALPSAYEPAAILGAPDDAIDGIRQDLAHLADTPGGAAFAAFVRAMLRVRPLARDGGWAGYRAPGSPDERAALALARHELDGTLRWTGPLPVLLAQRLLLAISACELEAADGALPLAREGAESRETLFGAAELALRRGDERFVRDFVARASAMPEARDDAWLAALATELDAHLRCP